MMPWKNWIRKILKRNIGICDLPNPWMKNAFMPFSDSFKQVLIIEDGILAGGFGSAVIEFMIDNGYQANVKRLGVPDTFVEHGTQAELYKECGFDADSISRNSKKHGIPPDPFESNLKN